MSNPSITINIRDFGFVSIELFPETAPNTVNNFLDLSQNGFYNGKIFHRVIEGFMLQGGCPDGTGMGGPSYNIPGEFSSNGFENNLKHDRGVISMARSGHPDSAGSQFFIMHQNSPHLDGQYASFGKVTAGLDVVDRIATIKTDMRDRPQIDAIIDTIDVNLNGYSPAPVVKA